MKFAQWENDFGETEQSKILAEFTYDNEEYIVVVPWRTKTPNIIHRETAMVYT